MNDNEFDTKDSDSESSNNEFESNTNENDDKKLKSENKKDENSDNEILSNNSNNNSDENSNNEISSNNESNAEEIIKKGDDFVNIVNDETSGNEDSDNETSNNETSDNNINDNSDLDFFDNDEDISIIEEKVAKEAYELEYDEDEIYLNDLENQFLSEYPVIKQNLKYIQDEALKKAKDVVELKKYGMSLLRKKHNDNHIIEDYLENKFNKHFIIPVVFDRRRKYRKIDTNDIVSNEEISQTDINEYKKDGVYTDDQRDQFKKLKLLDKKKLKFTDLLKETNELIKPYLLYDDKVKNGIEIEINESTELLRQFNSDGLDWRNRIAIAGHKYNQTDRSEDSGELEKAEKANAESLGEAK